MQHSDASDECLCDVMNQNPEVFRNHHFPSTEVYEIYSEESIKELLLIVLGTQEKTTSLNGRITKSCFF